MQKKTLKLNRDIIRQLRETEIKHVHGGRPMDDPTCPAGPESAPPGPIPPS